MTIEASIKSTHNLLVKYKEAYYNGTPLISDLEFDRLEAVFRLTAPTHPYFKTVGAPVTQTPWQKVSHTAPMGSLDKAHTEAELRAWAAKFAGQELHLSMKADGISLSLRYDNGHFTRAVTRGDGSEGEDISRNVSKMHGFMPKILGFTGHLRAEIIITKEDFAAHFEGYSNPRNAASGVAKRLSGEGCEHLTILYYQMIKETGGGIPSKDLEFDLFDKLGMPTVHSRVADLDATMKIFNDQINGGRDALVYEVDGLVIELNDTDAAEGYGDHNGRPRAAIALKFPSQRATTLLRDIVWQVGATGRVTPVANFDAVEVAGAVVTKATLHNVGQIQRLVGDVWFHEGDEIVVSRRGDVIPAVESRVKISDSGKMLVAPFQCPCCRKLLLRENDQLLCLNRDGCSAQVSGRMLRWMRKLSLKGWGPEVVNAAVGAGATHVSDLYKMTAADIAALPTSRSVVGTTTAKKLAAELRSKNTMTATEMLGALDIPLWSTSRIGYLHERMLQFGYSPVKDMRRVCYMSFLTEIDGVGGGIAESLIDWVQDHWHEVVELGKVLNIIDVSGGALAGKAICMTGFRDKEMEKAITRAGGSLKSSVSRKLDFLVAKNPEGSSGKIRKAKKVGVDVIGVPEMWSILKG